MLMFAIGKATGREYGDTYAAPLTNVAKFGPPYVTITATRLGATREKQSRRDSAQARKKPLGVASRKPAASRRR